MYFFAISSSTYIHVNKLRHPDLYTYMGGCSNYLDSQGESRGKFQSWTSIAVAWGSVLNTCTPKVNRAGEFSKPNVGRQLPGGGGDPHSCSTTRDPAGRKLWMVPSGPLLRRSWLSGLVIPRRYPEAIPRTGKEGVFPLSILLVVQRLSSYSTRRLRFVPCMSVVNQEGRLDPKQR